VAERELLAGVLMSPEEDAPRLVYADRLEEFGGESEGARAEFIRLQVRRAGLASEAPEAEAIRRREDELLRRHGQGWDVELRSLVPTCKYQRGFIETVTPYSSVEDDISPELRDFPALAGRLWDLAPIRKLRLFEMGEALRRVLACDRLASLADLHIERLDEAEDVRALASAPNLRQLTCLSFAAEAGAVEAVPGLFEAAWPRLRALSFSCASLTDAVAALVRSPIAGRLTTLEVTGTNGRRQAGRDLAASTALGGLTELSLGLGDRASAAVLRSPHLHSLRVLSLSHGDLGVESARALAAAPWLDSLEKLDLYYNHLGVAGCRALAKGRPANLKFLNLGCNGLGVQALEALASGLRCPRLAHLRLTHNHLDDGGIVALAGSPLLVPLSRLDLQMNHLGPTAARALAGSPYLAELKALNLNNNRIGTEGAVALVRSAALPRLVDFDVSYNDIDNEGVRFLAASPLLPRLRRLGVGGNHFHAEVLRGLLAALAATSIESLDMHDGHFGDEGAAALADAPLLPGLSFLDVSYCDLTDEGARRLLRCPWLAGVAHVKWGGNKIEDEQLLAALRERFPQ
jgi:uncharacterized protein (TIGR02996 family)